MCAKNGGEIKGNEKNVEQVQAFIQIKNVLILNAILLKSVRKKLMQIKQLFGRVFP